VEITATHNITLRITIQQKLLACMLKHCSDTEFNLFDLFALLSECVKAKSLKCGSTSWNEVKLIYFVIVFIKALMV